MANIQPFDYQKSTNIEEHNQIVNKVNEIVEVINNVNLDTINSEIASLKANATATDTEIANIKDKDTTQDTEIDGITKSLVSNVTATFDNPSRELKISLGREATPSIDATVVIPASSETGQYSAGNGITIDNYQISVNPEVVALKTDIQTINTEITGITNKNTEQDTAIAGKVAIAQGTENAGKVLGIGEDGNVTPVNTGGGEVWEEIDFNNFPTDWAVGDKIKFIPNYYVDRIGSASNWTSPINVSGTPILTQSHRIIETEVGSNGGGNFISALTVSTSRITINVMTFAPTASQLNSGSIFGSLSLDAFNGNSCVNLITTNITLTNVSDIISKMWRCRAST